MGSKWTDRTGIIALRRCHMVEGLNKPTHWSMPVDADRLAKLVDTHAAALELYAARWTGEPEDCVQEAFVELARQPTEPRSVAAWLFRVVKNRALNAARGEQRRRDREQAVARLRRISCQTRMAQTIDAEAVAKALANVESDASEIIVLRIWSGLSFDEIASVVGCSASTVHRRYRRALEQLREILEPSQCPMKSNCPKN